ncbi:NB-ARC domain-containing protein [Thermobifida cellulosilytica]|uniref:NB-ARC domain-containing protein n=1 Tax=Thermobifida cellulosilytica TB100 TaxID=665004 RepID=A0A147KL44_THECS|nr:NB-ARC domain-containing protein [Thermobifida cellulosilytica]KUP97973.1 hypothetical protein AC529_04145 [Thermobifida cellulosilytica TB100]
MTGDRHPATANTVHGDSGAVVQAAAVHGDVYVTGAAASQEPAPRQLPMAVTGFVNREAQLAYLDSLLRAGTEAPYRDSGGAVVISAIGGAPGVGKTALAVYWAHRVRSHYVDGDLYVNLRGHGPGPAMGAAQALDVLLRSLGVPPERIPDDLDGKAALYRSRLARKRMLIVIDDAVSADQVRPLLPASSTCLVLVTSRRALSGLVAREGAERVTLDVLSTEEAVDLLRRTVGERRVDAEAGAARALAAHCAHLPLALRILAERIISRPDTPLAEFAAELAAEDERLDALGAEDDELSDVRAVFSTSYRALDAESARVFRLLGVHPGAEFGVHAAAALAGLAAARTRRVLDRLVGVHLVHRVRDRRYRLHDLLRLYAAERLRQEESEEEQTAALRRLAGWYLRAVDNARAVTHPHFRAVAVPQDVEPAEVPVFDSTEEAIAWFDEEYANLLDVLGLAAERGQHDLAWRLPVLSYPLLELRGHWRHWREAHLRGVESARRAGDGHGLARNLLGLGDAEWVLGRNREALERYRAALDALPEEGDGWIEGFALRQIGLVNWQEEPSEEAVALIERAVAVFRRVGERRGEGMGLLSLAECARDRGRTGTALEYCRAALEALDGIGDTWSVAWGRCSLASVLDSAGRRGEALAEYRAAAEVFRGFADHASEAMALTRIGEIHEASGEADRARSAFAAAAELLGRNGDPEAERLRERAERLGAHG